MSNVESRRVISNRRRTVGLVATSAMRPCWRVTRRRPLSSTDRPVESMKSTSERSSTTAGASSWIASLSSSLNRGAVETWISPATVITCPLDPRSSCVSSNRGSVNPTGACLPARWGRCQTEVGGGGRRAAR